MADFDYPLPADRHRPDAGRAAGRGAPARRPGHRRTGRRSPLRRATSRGCCSRATSSSSTTPVCCRPGWPCAGPPAAASRCCCSKPRDRGGWQALVAARVPACATARCSASDGRGTWSWRSVERRRTTAHVGCAWRRARDAAGASTGTCRCRRTSRPARRPRAVPDRLRAAPGSVAAPTAGLHLTAGVLEPWRPATIAVARVELVVGLDTFKPVTAADPADHACTPSATRCRPRRSSACRAGASASWPSAPPRCVRSSRPRHRRVRGSHGAVHPPAVRLAGRRRPADELPPAPHDVADDGRRVRRPALARPVRHRPRRGLPLPVLRRRHAAGAPA